MNIILFDFFQNIDYCFFSFLLEYDFYYLLNKNILKLLIYFKNILNLNKCFSFNLLFILLALIGFLLKF